MSVSFRLGAIALAIALPACSSGYVMTHPDGPRGYIRLEVEPATATVEIDEVYSGVANGWRDGVVPVSPGMRRLTLSAEGYITQRFDIEVAPYEEVTLILALEPTLDMAEEPEEREATLSPLRARR